MKKNFFTTYNKEHNEIFCSLEESKNYISKADLTLANKKAFYKGVKRFDYEQVNLFPFTINLDFTLNSKWTKTEKNRLSVPTVGKTIELITLTKKIATKNGGQYTSVTGGGFLIYQKVCKSQGKNTTSLLGCLYYEMTDKKLFSFFKDYKAEYVNNYNNERVSFIKTINSAEEANQLFNDIHNFDKKYGKILKKIK